MNSFLWQCFKAIFILLSSWSDKYHYVTHHYQLINPQTTPQLQETACCCRICAVLASYWALWGVFVCFTLQRVGNIWMKRATSFFPPASTRPTVTIPQHVVFWPESHYTVWLLFYKHANVFKGHWPWRRDNELNDCISNCNTAQD